MNLSMIVAVSNLGVIGDSNRIPWDIPEDRKWFRDKTMGKCVIMGRRTHLSIDDGMLSNRHIIVLSSTYKAAHYQQDISSNGFGTVSIANDMKQALIAVKKSTFDREEVMIAGGALVYQQFYPYISKIYLTKVLMDIPGDTELGLQITAPEWKTSDLTAVMVSKTGYPYQYHTLVRSTAPSSLDLLG